MARINVVLRRWLVAAVMSTFPTMGLAAAAPEPTVTPLDDRAVAAEHYLRQLEQLLSDRIVPGLSRAILATARSRPSGLEVRLTREPSAYAVGAATVDSRLLVELSLDYVLLHDAALDGAALAVTFNRPAEFDRYLRYLVVSARAGRRWADGSAGPARAVTFAEFARLPSRAVRSTFADADWRAQRRSVQEASLAWVIAYLLVTADPAVGGGYENDPATAAARLVAAGGWFAVPPLATAYGWVEIAARTPGTRSHAETWCRAADYLVAGTDVAATSALAAGSGHESTDVSVQLGWTRRQVDAIRREHRCSALGTDVAT
jgi:hypothetical protein